MAAKKTKFGAKSAYVRSLSRAIPAKEVVAQAKKKGISLTENYVYTIRSSSGSTKGVRNKPGPKPGRKRGAAGGSAEVQLRNAIAALGLVKAREILGQVEAAFAGR